MAIEDPVLWLEYVVVSAFSASAGCPFRFGSARALFERALEMVAQHEGIALHEDPHEKLNPEAL